MKNIFYIFLLSILISSSILISNCTADANPAARFAINKDGKVGYINVQGEIVIEPQFEYAGKFSEGLAVVKAGDKYGYIDTNGYVAIEPKYFEAKPFSNGRAYVVTNNKQPDYKAVFIDIEGEEIFTAPSGVGYRDRFSDDMLMFIHFVYDPDVEQVPGFPIGTSIASFLDLNGEVVFTLDDCRSGRPFSGGLAAVEKEKPFRGPRAKRGKRGFTEHDDRAKEVRYGYIDDDGSKVILSVEKIDAASREGTGFGYVDKEGNVVIDFQYSRAGDFSEGVAMVEVQSGSVYRGSFSHRRLIDRTGNIVANVGTVCTHNKRFSEGLMLCGGRNGYGYIGKSGRYVIQPDFEKGDSFSEGYAAVQRGGKWGFIDKSGQIVIEPRFHACEKFTNGLAVCYGDNKLVGRAVQVTMFYVNSSGQIVYELQRSIPTDQLH